MDVDRSQSIPSCVHNFDFDNASHAPQWQTFENMLPAKTYRTKLREGKEVSTFRINKVDLEKKQVLTRMATKYKLDEKLIAFQYAIMNNGVQDEYPMTVDKSCDVEDLKTFYCQTSNMDLLVVFEKPKVRGKQRKKRPCEVASSELKVSLKGGLNESFYRTLEADYNLGDIYNRKRKYIQFLLGRDEGSNLLNPTNAICHVKHCMLVTSLKVSNNISTLLDHWKSHMKPLKTTYHNSCEVALRRNVFLGSKNSDPWKNIKYTIEEMEGMNDSAGDSLAIVQLTAGDDCFIAENGKKFRGDSLMVDLTVLDSILKGESNALASLPKTRKMTDCWARQRRSSTSSSSSSAPVIALDVDEEEEVEH